MALSKKTTGTPALKAKAKIVDHSKEIKALEQQVKELKKLLEESIQKIITLEKLSKQPVNAKDLDLRKKLSLWNSKLGKRL